MICSQCGQANADNVSFCAACGQKLATPATQVPDSRPAAVPLNPDAAQPTIPVNIPPPTMYGTPPQSPSGYSPPSGPQSLTGEPVPPAGGPVSSAPTVAYSGVCRVCGNPLTPRDYSCPRCSTPVGMVANPNDPTSAGYLSVGGVGYLENTSGQKGAVPLELQGGWNWGAAFLTFFWTISHRVWWPLYVMLGQVLTYGGIIGIWMYGVTSNNPTALILIIPLYLLILGTGIFMFVFMGIRGNSLGWQNRVFSSVAHFRNVQRVWATWVLWLFIVSLLLGVVPWVLLIVFALVAGSAGGTH